MHVYDMYHKHIFIPYIGYTLLKRLIKVTKFLGSQLTVSSFVVCAGYYLMSIIVMAVHKLVVIYWNGRMDG